jgi:hypothetical protein
LPAEVDSYREERQSNIATCFFDVLMSASLAARMGAQIESAIISCQSSTDPDAATRLCAVNILGVVASFGLGSAYLSSAVSHCPEFNTQQYAPCASKILTMVGALTGVGASAANYRTCALNATRAFNASEQEQSEDTDGGGPV